MFAPRLRLEFAPRLRLEFATGFPVFTGKRRCSPPDCAWSSPPVNAGVRPQIASGVRHSVLSAGVRWQFLTFAFATYSSRGYSLPIPNVGTRYLLFRYDVGIRATQY